MRAKKNKPVKSAATLCNFYKDLIVPFKYGFFFVSPIFAILNLRFEIRIADENIRIEVYQMGKRGPIALWRQESHVNGGTHECV